MSGSTRQPAHLASQEHSSQPVRVRVTLPVHFVYKDNVHILVVITVNSLLFVYDHLEI